MKKLLLVSSLSFAVFGSSVIQAQSLSAATARSTNSVGSQSVRFVNINQATVKQLTALKGLGKKRAQAIVSYRQAHGAFKSVAGLVKVKGIGQALLKKIYLKNQVKFTLS